MNLRQLNRILQQMFWLPIFALLVVSGVLVSEIALGVRTVYSIQIADRNIETATHIETLIVDEETGLRGYQNTGNEIFLQPYDLAAKPLGQAFSDLRLGIARGHGDPAVIDQLVADHSQWQTQIAIPLIVAIRTGTNTHDTGVNLRGKAHMDSIRAQLGLIEQQQRKGRNEAVERWGNQVRHTIEAVIGLSIVIGLMLGVYGRSQLHKVTAGFQNALIALRRHGAEVHASEHRLRTVLTSIGDAVVVCDLQGRVELMNSVAEQLTGWTAAEAQRKPVPEIIRTVEESSREPFNLLTPKGQTRFRNGLSQQAVLIRRDGSEVIIDPSCSTIHDNTGKATGTVLVFRDITDQRHTQAALLASEKFAVAGRLAATIAHEIHNPLDAVMNLLYLMRHGATPEESREFLDMASSELDRVAQITRAMLGMYRESRQPVAVDMGELLSSLLLLLSSQLMQAHVTVQSDLEPECVVTGYPAELRQVFTNLLTNALDASVRGDGVRLQCARTTSGEQKGVRVVVADHGSGISEDAMHHLFQPFFTTKGQQGTGLGLWVSQGIVEKHGGSIEVESQTGEHHGTTISVFLPSGAVPTPSTQPGETVAAV